MFKKIYKLIYSSQDQGSKNKIILLTIMSMIASILETLTIISFMPLITVFMDMNILYNSEFFLWFEALHSLEKEQIIYFLTLISLSIILFSFLASIFVNHYNYRVSAELGKIISLRVYKKYLDKDILYFNKKFPVEITKIITFEVPRILERIIQPSFRLIVKIFLILIITILIMIYNIKSSIIIFFTVLLYYLFFNLIFKKKILLIGEYISTNQSKMFKATNETFNFIREIKIFKKAFFFKSKFIYASEKFYESLGKIAPIAMMPRIILENLFLIIVLIIISILSLKIAPDDISQIIISFSFYIICFLKLIPAFQNSYYEYANIKSANETLEIINEIYYSKKNNKYENENDVKFNNDIHVDNISFNYEGKDKLIFKNVNFKIFKNQTYAIIGKTGSGKSTIVDIISGLIQISTGQINIDGNDFDSINKSKWQENISLVKQNFFGLNDSILHNIVLDEKYDEEKLMKVLSISKLESFVKEKKDGVNYIIGENGSKLSGGQKQRLSIARALYHVRDILILDEATSALDDNTENYIIDAIEKNYNLTLIIITHNKKIADRMKNIINVEDFVTKEFHEEK